MPKEKKIAPKVTKNSAPALSKTTAKKDSASSSVSTGAGTNKAVPPKAPADSRSRKSIGVAAEEKGKAKPVSKAKPGDSAKPDSKVKPDGSAKPVSKAKPGDSAKPVSKVKPDSRVKPDGSAKSVSKAKPVTNAKPATKAKLTDKAVPSLAGKRRKSPDEIDERFISVDKNAASEIMRLLCQTYPDAQCELTYETTFQLLTAVILSAQTTDVGVNRVTPVLFKKYPDARALAEADLDDIKSIVKPTGYYNSKATNIQRCAQGLMEKFGGVVPKTLEELTLLPGVGRKTANVVLGVAYHEPAWTVDTHVQRLVRRLGFTPETDPLKIEFALQKVFPDQDWSNFSITLIWHGRRVCFARKPDCPACPVNHLCPSAQI